MSSTNLERWFSRLAPPIEGIYRAWATVASKRLTNLLGSPVQIDIAQIDAIRSDSGLVPTSDASMLDFKLDIPDASDPWILSIQSSCVYHWIDRLLGASANESPDSSLASSKASVGRVVSSIDSKVASYALEELAYACLDLWQIEPPPMQPRARLLLNDENPAHESIRVCFQLGRWQGQWLIPESFIKQHFGRLVFGSDQSVTLHAILARSAIERTELRQLEVGDIISTEQLASQPADVECRGVTGDMEILFRGQTGLYKDSKALRLLGS